MEAFTTHRGIVATLDRANVDTDQIIPKQFLKSIQRSGFGPSLFFDWRYLNSGELDPAFELNASRFEGKSILITRNNFGCGSSREHAVWALAQDGYRVVVAPSSGSGEQTIPAFADIFRNNCSKNGLLTLELSETQVQEIFEMVAAKEGCEASVDLHAQTLTVHADEEAVYNFEIGSAIKDKLMKGLDDIAMTLEHIEDIRIFEGGYDPLLQKRDTLKPTLVVLAAGMGSRYGGLKQIDPIGPAGEVVLDYSVFDAIRAGFGKVVFVIRKDIEADFKEVVEPHFKGRIPMAYAYQELDDLPEGFDLPEGRTKPWGTNHALLACRHLINEPFGVINADDFYGPESFQLLADWLKQQGQGEKGYCLVGFRMSHTLSEHGGVSRGLCEVDADEHLLAVEECHHIEPRDGGVYIERGAGPVMGDGSETVSMNMWGLTPDFFTYAEAGFVEFLQALDNPLKGEYYLPKAVDDLIQDEIVQVEVLHSEEKWYGVTYPEDKPSVETGVRKLIDAGRYPEALWG